MTERIEAQIERFAPGFRDIIEMRGGCHRARSKRGTRTTREAAIHGRRRRHCAVSSRAPRCASRRIGHRIPVYSSAPHRRHPVAGVHGMCGYYAAREALPEADMIIPVLITPRTWSSIPSDRAAGLDLRRASYIASRIEAVAAEDGRVFAAGSAETATGNVDLILRIHELSRHARDHPAVTPSPAARRAEDLAPIPPHRDCLGPSAAQTLPR
jgi:hypothetical protein